MQILNEEPLIELHEQYISDVESAELIALARPNLQRALVSSAKAGTESKGRTGANCWLKHNVSPVVQTLCQRISDQVGIPLLNAESLQMIYYNETQEYAPHFDAWLADSESGQRCMARGGQRLVTCLLYLNDVERGGGTIFPKLKLEVDARKGRLLIFRNCHPGTNQRHPHSLHGGMPVLSGEKWACNLWFRERKY